MANSRIPYTSRDFEAVRADLINYVRQYYPDVIDNFNDASIFSVLLDLNAGIADNLNYQIDRSIQETVLQFAQQKSSVFNIARTYGLKIPGNRPSVAVADISITVPAFGDKEDERYLGVLRRGSQVIGGGQTFELIYDCDFSSQYNTQGFNNRTKIPNFDANNVLINYTITKREPVINGITKVFKKVVTPADSRPFLNIFLPERNVLGVTSVIQKDGTNYANVPSNAEFISSSDKWYEVYALAEDRVFVEDSTKPSDKPGVKVGKYIQTNNRFITEFTPEGFLKMTFGGGTTSSQELLSSFSNTGVLPNIQTLSNNFSLGATLKPNTTLFIQYRVGGGKGTNLGTNVITQIGNVDFSINGPSSVINNQVKGSLRVTNPVAAVGGADKPTLEEARNFVAFNFAAQKRAVTINDYQSLIQTMPGQFGAPAKVNITEEDNKIKIQMLSYDADGKLTPIVSNTIKQNVANYLSNYRMINDYIYIESGQVIDLKFQVQVVLDAVQNQGEVITNIVNTISTYMDPINRVMGQDVFIAELNSLIQNVAGVITVTSIDVFNMLGGQYSSDPISQPYSDETTKQIQLIDQTIFAQPNQMCQVRFPSKDILVSTKNFSGVNIS